MSEKRPMKLETKLIVAGEPSPRIQGVVTMPIFQSSTYLHHGDTGYHGVRYLRLNNTPNHEALHRKLAALENAESALVTSSGAAAISATLLTVLSPGDHLMAHRALYGGTHDLITEELARFKIEHSFVDAADPSSWAAALRPNTRAFYVETITNPLMEVGCLDEVAKFAREHRLVSIIDNTFATPVSFRPSEHGFTLSLHSATKYLNGHSDIVAGAVIGEGEWVERIRRLLNHLGGTLDPHACFLLQRGLRTLALRMRAQSSSGLALARFLQGHPAVEKVNYPFLESSPSFANATRLLNGGNGMLSLELRGGRPAADRFLAALTLPLVAPSLGGTETLVVLPATTSHVGLDPKARAESGVTEGLVRVSVGLEDIGDLIADFDLALRAATS